MATGRGYAKYFESWHPATINEQEGVVDNIKTLFIEQSIDSRIEAALPLLAKIQQRGHEMKEADIFENWINNLAEGTWTLPETPEQLDKLKTLMTKELIVGPDATNATEQLYSLVGDDVLFDQLQDLAEQDPDADCRSIVIARITDMASKGFDDFDINCGLSFNSFNFKGKPLVLGINVIGIESFVNPTKCHGGGIGMHLGYQIF